MWTQMSGIKSETAVLTNRANPPVPSPLDSSELAGPYRHEGYGTLEFRVHDGQLIAKRNDVWLRYSLELEHASGSWWVAFLNLTGANIRVAFPVEFRIGADGKPTALNVVFKNDMLGMDEGCVLFERT